MGSIRLPRVRRARPAGLELWKQRKGRSQSSSFEEAASVSHGGEGRHESV